MALVAVLPRGRPLTRDDLDAMPDDGHRYELVDGTLIVTPAPRPRHQLALARVERALAAVCPAGLEVLFAPLDVVLSDDTIVQPDIVVARAEDFAEGDLPVPPLLAIEVLSPSTRLVDLNLKRARYERARCPSYWVVDPDQPSIIAWELVGGSYRKVCAAAVDDTFSVSAPFPVTLIPSRLIP